MSIKNPVHHNIDPAYRGVTWYEPAKKWRARIKFSQQLYSLGLFDNEEEAREIVREAWKIAQKYLLEFEDDIYRLRKKS